MFLLSLVRWHGGDYCVLGALSPVGFGSDVVVLASLLHYRKCHMSSSIPVSILSIFTYRIEIELILRTINIFLSHYLYLPIWYFNCKFS